MNGEEQHQKEREVLFENETLAVKVLQAVPGASIVAALAQADTLMELAGKMALLLFVTAMAVALLAAVFAVHWKHQYKMYDVKAAASLAEGNRAQAEKRWRCAGIYLTGMRVAMWVALIAIAAAFAQLLFFLWLYGLRTCFEG